MKTIYITFILLFLFTKLFSETFRIAVSEIDPKGVTESEAAIVTEFLRNDLFTTGRFNVLERSKMNEILGEIAFQQTGCTTAECAVEIGKILNVEKMIVGSLSKLGNSYYISIRFVDVQTGTVEFADRVSCECPIDILPTSVSDLAVRIAKNVYKKDESKEGLRDLSVTEGTGIVYIKSLPEGAEVYLDGSLKGTASLALTNTKSGTHFIKIKWKDGMESEDIISLQPNEVKRLEYKAENAITSNKLTILSEPLDSDVYLDENYIGKTPVIKSNISSGLHKIMFIKGQIFATTEVELNTNENRTLRFNLKNDLSARNLDDLILHFEPGPLKVFINGEFIKDLSGINSCKISELFDVNQFKDFIVDRNANLCFVGKNEYALFYPNELFELAHNNTLIKPQKFEFSINPENYSSIIYINGLNIGNGNQIIKDINFFIRNNKLYFFKVNELLSVQDNRAYFYYADFSSDKSISIKTNEFARVEFNISPDIFSLQCGKFTRVSNIKYLHLKPGVHQLNLRTSERNKAKPFYKKDIIIDSLGEYSIVHTFN